MPQSKHDVYLVGTIPFRRFEQVFREVATIVGTRAPRCPDGEIGDRQWWVLSQYATLASCPVIEVGAYPEGGVSRATSWEVPLHVRKGADVSPIASLDLGYARYAISSYGVFRSLKAVGVIPKSWRFQVNIPTASDIVSLVVPEDRGLIEEPLDTAIFAELADARGGVLERYVRYSAAVAPGVELGLHLCYGDQDHTHAVEPRELGTCVDLANQVAVRIERPIDYVHMPVPRDRSDHEYFAPLAKLDHDRVKHAYLGLIHYTDGIAGTQKRMASASKYLDDFGIATECGFGRRPSDHDIRNLLKMHADLAG